MLTRIDHVGIACRDLETKIAFYESVMGLTVVGREVNESQGVREAMLHVADGPAGRLLRPAARAAEPGHPGRAVPGPARRGGPPRRLRRGRYHSRARVDRRQRRAPD